MSLIALCLALPASAETLREAITAAYATNPQLAAARVRQEALAKTPEQARALGRPTVSAGASAGYKGLGYGNADSASVSAALPIWTGGRVRSAVHAAGADVAASAERCAILRPRSCKASSSPMPTCYSINGRWRSPASGSSGRMRRCRGALAFRAGSGDADRRCAGRGAARDGRRQPRRCGRGSGHRPRCLSRRSRSGRGRAVRRHRVARRAPRQLRRRTPRGRGGQSAASAAAPHRRCIGCADRSGAGRAGTVARCHRGLWSWRAPDGRRPERL